MQRYHMTAYIVSARARVLGKTNRSTIMMLPVVAFMLCVMAHVAKSESSSAMPDDQAFFTYAQEQKLSLATLNQEWTAFQAAQKGRLTTNDLIILFEAKRDSVKSISTAYSIADTLVSRDGRSSDRPSRLIQNVRSGDKLYIEERSHTDDSHNIGISRRSYDGSTYRSYFSAEECGHITSQGARWQLFDADDAISQAMLVNTEHDTSTKDWHPYDIVAFLRLPTTVILQKPVIYDGRPAIAVVSQGYRVYLDPERDYSVIGLESRSLQYDANGTFIGVVQDYVRHNRDLQSVGNGIWLPRRITQSWSYPDGSKQQRNTIVQELSINKEIDNSFFVQIFPVGKRILDERLGVEIQERAFSDIGKMIDESLAAVPSHTPPATSQSSFHKEPNSAPLSATLQKASAQVFQWPLIGAVAFVCGISIAILIVWGRRRRKAKCE